MAKVAFCIEIDEDEAEVIFREESQLSTLEDRYQLARRSPEWDEYASLGYVPAKAKFDAGWWQRCEHCGATVWDEEIGPVFDGKYAFCSEEHQNAERAVIAEQKQRYEDARLLLSSRFPDLFDLFLCGGHPGFPVYGSFSLPGFRFIISWNDRSPDEYSIRPEDEKAWKERGDRHANN